MDYDQVLEHVGQFGLWQKLVIFMASLAAMAEAFMTLQFSFIGYSDFQYVRCFIPQCDNQTNPQFSDIYNFTRPNTDDKEELACLMHPIKDPTQGCVEDNFDLSQNVACDAYIFDTQNIPYGNSLVQELDLPPCTQSDWPLNPLVSQMAFINMGYMFGLLIGSFLFGILSDKYGRRKALLVGALISGGLSLSMSFIKNYWAYFALRLFLGIFSKSLFMLAFMIAVEISGVNYKTYLGILIQVPFAIGEMLVGLVAYLLQDWYRLQQTMSGIVLGLVILWYFMPESPRWLLSKSNKYQEAIKVLTNGAKYNRRPLPEGFLRYDDGTFRTENTTQEEQLGLKSLFRPFYMARISSVLFLNWITATMCYYGLTMLSVNLTDDIYLAFVLSALIEIPSYIFCVLFMDHMGRKPILVFCQLLAGSTCIVAAFLDADSTGAITAFTLAGKFGASSAFAIIYLYTAELYPTVIRNTALGTASMLARIGGILAPLLASLKLPTPLIIMGGSALLAGILAVFLPETLGSSLPETIHEVKLLFENSKKWWKWVSKKELANLQKPRPEQSTKPKDTPVAKVAPSPKPTAFVIPSIMVDPGTPKGTLKAAKPRKEPESVAAPEMTSKPTPLPQITPEPVPKPFTEPTPPTAPESVPKPTTAPTPATTPEPTPTTTPEVASTTPVSKTALAPGPSHKPSTAIVAPPPPFMFTTPPVIEETAEVVDTPAPIETSDTTDSGQTIEVKESNENLPKVYVEEAANSSLAVGSSNESRRFSQLPPASAESPNAVKLGHFAVIPTPSKEKIEAPKPVTLGSELKAQESEKSRRFSQLPPASVDSPNAVKVGKFGVVPTPEKAEPVKPAVALSPIGRLLIASAQEEKSRRFSKLPPASADSPNAVKLGSKFTMISREQDEQK